MSAIDEIKTAINSLSVRDYEKLRKWFAEKDEKAWDREIEEDSKSGKLDFLVKEAVSAESKSETGKL